MSWDYSHKLNSNMRSQRYHQEPANSNRDPLPEAPEEPQKLIDQDPYGPSYHESAIKYIPYRIGILVFAVFMIVIGKSSLPSDEVPCIQDVVLDALQPVTNFYINNEGFGLTLIALMQIIVDVELVVVIVYWFVYGTNMRYPLVLAIIGVSKILLNVLFQTKLIDDSFNKRPFPSLVFGSNFEHTYFFSGVACLMMTILLELYQLGHRKLFYFQLCALVFVVWVLLSARQNFFMDIATALVFTHYVFYFINDRIETIDRAVFAVYDKMSGSEELQEERREDRI